VFPERASGRGGLGGCAAPLCLGQAGHALLAWALMVDRPAICKNGCFAESRIERKLTGPAEGRRDGNPLPESSAEWFRAVGAMRGDVVLNLGRVNKPGKVPL
jgi:hypothetical protein